MSNRSLSIVINARTQSSRVPNKLIRRFSNSNLIEIALSKFSCLIKHVDALYFAVAEEVLFDIGEKYTNFKILKREPASVEKGTHKQTKTFKHFFDIKSDYIMIINPCQPLLSVETIKNAIKYFNNTNYETYTTVIKTSDWIFNNNGNPVTNSNRNDLTSDNKGFFKATHSLHIINKERFRKNGYLWSFKKNDPHLIEIFNEEEILDVDNELDFQKTEAIYKMKNE